MDAEPHDGGLAHDLPRLMDRRRAIALLGGAGIAALGACSGGDATSEPAASSATPPSTTTPSTTEAPGSTTTAGGPSSTTATSAATPTSAAPATTGPEEPESCEVIPAETAGPFPANGSNGPDALGELGVERRDITSSFGAMSGTADGVPFAIALTVLNTAAGCAPYEGAAVYVWHCDRQGRYSLYSDGATDQNYLRGVQVADAAGTLRFESIFPACYPGRWPHVHFEVYPDLASATSASNKLATSQIAIPADVSEAVYASPGYEASAPILAGLSLESDGVFRDGWSRELGTVEGGVGDGVVIALTVPV
ncbi:MAG: hypothetical protein S0880_15055 [Actinomycetota bacterium]|nr:hypothetical protein [Actinomycetota bacterium]